MITEKQAFAVEHLHMMVAVAPLAIDDLTDEQEDAILVVLDYISELEAQVKTHSDVALQRLERIGQLNRQMAVLREDYGNLLGRYQQQVVDISQYQRQVQQLEAQLAEFDGEL